MRKKLLKSLWLTSIVLLINGSALGQDSTSARVIKPGQFFNNRFRDDWVAVPKWRIDEANINMRLGEDCEKESVRKDFTLKLFKYIILPGVAVLSYYAGRKL